MVWRQIEDVRARAPAIAMGTLSEYTSEGEERNDGAQIGGWIGLMLEHFKKCDDVEFYRGVVR